MTINDFDIAYTADLARIELSDDERKSLGEQLIKVIEYVEKLAELDVENVSPTAHPLPLKNVMRADFPRPSLPNQEALANAPSSAKGLFRVPRIVE